MQIKGDEFIKKVQIQQEREELERKLNELEEVEMSINNDSVILERNNTNDYNSNSYNNHVEPNEHELDNIMLGSSNANEDNKKKYLILGIVLVVLFLLTIIIIRLLTNDAPKEDQFTSNSASSTEMKKLQDSDNIEENFQKIINERVKKDTNEPMVPEVHGSTTKSNNEKAEDSNTLQAFENLQKEAESYNSKSTGISDEAIDQTIKKVERSKSSVQKEKITTTPASTQKEEVVTKKVETKKSSIKDLVETNSENTVSNSMSSGYFIQIGAFTKKPTDSYVSTIRNAKLKYKIYQDTVNGVAYNKVLIGPYSSKATASENVEDVKQKLNVTSAFVVKF
ncbi:MAG: SPOR domain-containing protein [Arcobacteraceae bacterium]